MVHLKIEIGERTTACLLPTHCPYVRTTRNGRDYGCGLFEENYRGAMEMTPLRDETGEIGGRGTLRRLPECLAAEQREGDKK